MNCFLHNCQFDKKKSIDISWNRTFPVPIVVQHFTTEPRKQLEITVQFCEPIFVLSLET